jgi:RNA polymerase sigma-70 factor (ECF subfamily)
MLAEDSEYAFQLLFDTHRNRIYQTALRFLKSPVLAQDVVQDVFLKLWIKRKTLNPDQGAEAWLCVVARNNIFNRLKRLGYEWQAARSIRDVSGSLPPDSDFLHPEEFELKKQLAEAIHSLPTQQRTAFQLSRFEGLSYIEIGDKLHISPLTVKTHIARAISHIKKRLENKGLFPPF